MMRILVVDDDDAIRKMFHLTLEDTDYSLDTAESGEEALRLVKEHRYDLIYLDLKMPRMNGVETLRELRKIVGKIPIYIITAYHQEFFAQLKSAIADGIDFELLRKPVDHQQLILITESILGKPKAYR